ncbi:MAG: hypothetical protein G8D28_05920 [gamma proteobacterium symbiont of Phacoides pectinatus]
MPLYSANALISQARKLAAEYRRTMGKPLPGISNEIALHDAMELLRLQPAPEGGMGYDAIDPARDGLRIQIKSRTIFDESKSGQRIGQIKVDQEWDLVVLVLMDEEYEPYEIYGLERDELLEQMARSSSKRARRGALSIARFKIIGRLVWTRDGGVGAEIWDNQG